MNQEPALERPIPTARGIHWQPSGHPGSSADPHPVFIASRVLRAVQEHVSKTPQHGALGFLVGDLCVDPRSRVRYLLIDSTIRLNQPIYGDRTTVVVGKLWTRIEGELDKVQGQLLGWYHSHPPHGVGLTMGDVEAHARYFTAAWQVALVIGNEPGEGGPAAELHRPGGDPPTAGIPLPFFELADETDDDHAPGSSALPWTNFRTDVPVTHHVQAVGVQKQDDSAASPTTLQVTGREEAIMESDSATRATALAGLPLIHGGEGRPAPPPERRAGEGREPISSAPPPRLPLMEPEITPAGRAFPALRTVAVGAAVLLVVATAVVAGRTLWPQRTAEQPTTATDRDVDPSVVRLDELADSLANALAAYGPLQPTGGAGAMSCEALQQRFRTVDEAWIAYSARGRRWVSVLDAARDARDERLYARVDSVDRHFSASGCSRP